LAAVDRERRVTSYGKREGRLVALIVTPRYLPLLGGMERECALLAAEFARRGFEPVIVTEQLGERLPRYECTAGIAVFRIPSSPKRSPIVQAKVAARLVWLLVRHRRRAAFAVVRTMTLPALVVGLLKALRIITFPTLVTAETGGADDDVVALSRRPFFRVTRFIVASNDRLNGLCIANVDHLRRHGFPNAKITMIPNGIDTSAWAATQAPERVNRFLFLGRIERGKGVFELVEAFTRLRGRVPGLELRIAGEGDDTAALVARCAVLGIADTIEFLGRIEYERVGALLDSIDCLVLPSYSEGMPLSVLEAAAHHRVLVVSDVGDIRRLFGDRIHLCRPRDTAALEAAMEAASASPPVADYADVIDRVSIGAVAGQMLAELGLT
jgi:glycosyltransferase involved in cell wall biosynthesis